MKRRQKDWSLAGRIQAANLLFLWVKQFKMAEVKTSRKRFDSLQLKALGEVIKNAPPPAKILTKKEALAALAPELKVAANRGHSSTSLVDVLAGAGLQVSMRAVAQVLRLDGTKLGIEKKIRSN